MVAELVKIVQVESSGCEWDFVMEPCSTDKQIYTREKQGEEDFFYMYKTQLHPYGWVALQAFKVIYYCLRMEPIATKFLHYYLVRLGLKMGWVSLTVILKTCLFNAYSTSYKEFKARFIKSRDDMSACDKLNMTFLNQLHQGMNCKDIVKLVFVDAPVRTLCDKCTRCAEDTSA
ncbi:hypothetical protein CR513_38086, partial [Mucuna pruriens]